nr:immunoglobulin light chain junction region [Macaca mulatta]MPN82615.1 immunoglobulin light chain junction region [Macaca mulatta]
CQQYNSNPLAF